MTDTCLPLLPNDCTPNRDESHLEPRSAQTKSQHEASDPARTSRLTENKRRYRARQKEYVADFERRLAEARAHGISATEQVQLAARQVVAENSRLRELLQLAGFDDEDIDVWAKRKHCGNGTEGADCARRRKIEQRARLCATLSAGPRDSTMEKQRIGASRKCDGGSAVGVAGNTPESKNTPSRADEPIVSPEFHESTDLDAQMATRAAASKSEASPTPRTGSCATPGADLGPCKLLSRLAKNPQSDIMQVTAHQDSADALGDRPAETEEGVECKEAYEMLMRYATSEDKMDYVARALETGCTSTGKGSCAVKKKVIWEALDGMCG
ncbi:hypothetical protein QBC37DRAFT_324312 [Rhypophila decipiens]|uniref:BZIP domain-containing protein n=1 Tax=Rhypophila decipiens TaxID=261697 RepID=A0AAN7B5V3_9PEZI|nr:hypothetical protein QBC37DRAFT_324312 [Rhypophila decipiens]